MKIILDVATILGGLAALWFFWDKFRATRHTELVEKTIKLSTADRSKTVQRKLEHIFQQDVESLSSKGAVPLNELRRNSFLVILEMSCCALGGVATGIFASGYGRLGFGISLLVSMAITIIGMEVEEHLSIRIAHLIRGAAGVMFVSGFIGRVVIGISPVFLDSPFEDSGAATWFTMICGIAGAIQGFIFATDNSWLYAAPNNGMHPTPRHGASHAS